MVSLSKTLVYADDHYEVYSVATPTGGRRLQAVKIG